MPSYKNDLLDSFGKYKLWALPNSLWKITEKGRNVAIYVSYEAAKQAFEGIKEELSAE